MAEVTRLVCDKCGAEEGVERYRVSTPETGLGKTLAIDLCDDCAAPLLELSQYGQIKAATRSTPKSRAYRHSRGGPAMRAKIFTPEELDRMEQEQKTAPE